MESKKITLPDCGPSFSGRLCERRDGNKHHKTGKDEMSITPSNAGRVYSQASYAGHDHTAEV